MNLKNEVTWLPSNFKLHFHSVLDLFVLLLVVRLFVHIFFILFDSSLFFPEHSTYRIIPKQEIVTLNQSAKALQFLHVLSK